MRALYRKQGALYKSLLKTIFKNVWIKEKDSHIFAHTKQQQNEYRTNHHRHNRR